MGFIKTKIETFGKPYRHVGWHSDGSPKFVKKQKKVLTNELASVGLEPVYDESGWFVGTTRKVEEVATPTNGIPDHTPDSENFRTEIMEGPPLIGEPFFKKMGTMSGRFPAAKPNPCGEIHLPPQDAPTVFGHKLYRGPGVDVSVWVDDSLGSRECEVHIRQTRCGTDKTISFGPLSTNLSTLFEKGYWLETKLEYKHFNLAATRYARVYLTDGTDRYRLYSLDFHELQAMGERHGQYDLGAAIPNGLNLLRTHSSARYPKPVIQERIVEVERDPFDILRERYPQRGKKERLTLDTVIGNRTLGERLADHT